MRIFGRLFDLDFLLAQEKLLEEGVYFDTTTGMWRSVNPPHKNILLLGPGYITEFKTKFASDKVSREHPDATQTEHETLTAKQLAEWGNDFPKQSSYDKTRAPRHARGPLNPRRVKRTPPKGDGTPKTALDWLREAAKVLTERRIANGETIDYTAAFKNSLGELEAGYFNPAHWRVCDRIDVTHWHNVPTTGPDTEERSYLYPDPDNIRTLATYGDGDETTGPPRYSGNSLLGHFRDSLLVWSRETFKLGNPIPPGAVEPTFIEINGQIRAFANRRGSRPMLSYIVKTWLCADDSDQLTTVAPPTIRPWSFYYRYKVPDTPPPYYAQENVTRAIRNMRQHAHWEDDRLCKAAVVLLAPRPMYGRGFNNNASVTTQLIADTKIWQIHLGPPGGDVRVVCLWTVSGNWNIVPELDLGYDPILERLHVGAGSDTTVRATGTLIIADAPQVKPALRLAAAAALDEALAATPMLTGSRALDTIVPAVEQFSPYYSTALENIRDLEDDWLRSQDLDRTSFRVYLSLIWDSADNSVRVLAPTEMEWTEHYGIAPRPAVLAAYAAPGTVLYADNWQFHPGL